MNSLRRDGSRPLPLPACHCSRQTSRHMIAVHYDVVTVLPLRALIKIISEDALRKAHTLPMQTAVATVRTSLITVMALAQYHDSLTDTRRIHIIYDKFPKENSMNNYRKKTMIIYPNHY